MISLWMCANATYPSEGGYISCSKGHDLGIISPRMVKRGKPLVCRACNPCKDCDIMGNDIQRSERGWE